MPGHGCSGEGGAATKRMRYRRVALLPASAISRGSTKRSPSGVAKLSLVHVTSQRPLSQGGYCSTPAVAELPGGSAWTYSIPLGDLNADGAIDVVVGNYGAPNQLLPYTLCDAAGTHRLKMYRFPKS